MEYVYAGRWLIIGLLLIFRFGRENKIFYAAGGFFIFMGGWWLVDALIETDLFTGVWGWIFRGVMAVALILMCLAYYRSRKEDKRNNAKPEENKKPALPSGKPETSKPQEKKSHGNEQGKKES